MKIAVDAMGGDNAPAVVVEGAVAAVRELGASVILVGDSAAIEQELARLGPADAGVDVRHASQVVSMAESPSHALRRKRDSSLRIAAELVRDGKASAFVSAGNTGAAMAISMFVIGVLRGVDRPAIAAVLPNLKKFTVLLDVGANVDPKPWHMFQFAVMGNVYARDILGIDTPRVGLLSVGAEEGKGNELTKEAYDQLKESSLNFVGNVEGRDIYNGHCDVVVTDGFTGSSIGTCGPRSARSWRCPRSSASAGASTTPRWVARHCSASTARPSSVTALHRRRPSRMRYESPPNGREPA